MIVGCILGLSCHVELASEPGPARPLGHAQNDIPLDISVHVFTVVEVVLVRVAQIANVRAQNRKESTLVQNCFSFRQLQRTSVSV